MDETRPMAGTAGRDDVAADAPSARPRTPAGLFLSLEGADGAGKTTQCGLLRDALRATGRAVTTLREPGGTRLGEGVRRLVLDPDALDEGVPMSPVAELMLYEAARAQLVAQVIRPALRRGDVVVSDRFVDSTLAYQGFARGLGEDVVARANALACGGTLPARTLLLDVDPGRALSRALSDHEPDRLEREGVRLQELVRRGFDAAARRDPARVHVIDAGGTVAEVYERVRADLADLVALPAFGAFAISGRGAGHGRG